MPDHSSIHLSRSLRRNAGGATFYTILIASLAWACSSGSGRGPGGSGAGPVTGTVTTGMGGATSTSTTSPSTTSGGASWGGTAGMPATDCTGDQGSLLAAKRIVRLTLDQINNSVKAFIDPTISTQIATDYELHNPETRTFPALLGEGGVFTDGLWSKTDGIAAAAGQYVHDNFAAVTGCAAGDYDCATTYVTEFAGRAYRRPLTAEEAARIQQVVTEAQTIGATAEEAAEHGVYAALSAPQFLYRSELGTDPAAEELLTPYELASMVSYFITGGPPDDQLLSDAAAGTLNSPDAIRVQADRLITTAEAQENLQNLVFAYFGIPNTRTVVITAPEFTSGVANSMVRAGQLFINNTLWSGASVNDLLLSQTAWVNDQLAPLYGVSVPGTVDADGFGPVQLTPDRAGILTNVGYLASTARPDFPSVVARGVKVVDQFLCLERAPFPENLGEQIKVINMMLEGQTERQKAEYRFVTPPCDGCHLHTDKYGLSLFSYDEIGRLRDVDPEGNPIDATVEMPDYLGNQVATTSFEMAQIIAESNNFMACMAGNLMEDAIGEGAVYATDCAAQNVVNALLAGSTQTFPDLVREVVASRTMAFRRGGM